MLHELTNSEEYLYKKSERGATGLLGASAIELVKDATALLQFISFEKCRQANLSIEWELYCEEKGIPFMKFHKSYAVRQRINNNGYVTIGDRLILSPTSLIFST